MARMGQGRFRNELVLGMMVVVILSSLVTWWGIHVWSGRDFDSMVRKGDVDTARAYAGTLALFYGSNASWTGVESAIKALPEYRPVPDLEAIPPVAPGASMREGGRERMLMVLTDERGALIYNGLDRKNKLRPLPYPLPRNLDVARGEPVVWQGRTVGYVFYKSMLIRSYNPYEQEFVASLGWAIGLSVLVGMIMAVGLGALLAGRIARPVVALDHAVQEIAAGKHAVRVQSNRRDEIGSLARSFNRMADSLQAAEAARQNLIADIAHELRTPVSVIQANLELIMDKIYLPDDARMQGLYDETRILSDLIGDLRAISDLDCGLAPVRIEPVDIGGLVADSVQGFKPLFDERHIELAVDDSLWNEGEQPSRSMAMADPERMRQVLRNILMNALKYAPESSTLRLQVQGARGDVPMIRVAVLDEGPGVPPGDTERIFERFYRVDASRNRESGGRGLGLAICRQFVERCGGRIGAVNREPTGLEVWFELPASPGA